MGATASEEGTSTVADEVTLAEMAEEVAATADEAAMEAAGEDDEVDEVSVKVLPIGPHLMLL